ncbi:protein disulfide-isomerase A4-like [Babylonia areolata]|uniref:protein disulfide-isomerase A4-like n=1 Tax=Babylonia areolata TaxID=304850 RepID=UPI003FD3D39C
MNTAALLLLVCLVIDVQFISCEEKHKNSAQLKDDKQSTSEDGKKEAASVEAGEGASSENYTEPIEDEDGVWILSRYNFDNFTQNTKTVMVEFYAPWCGHCKEFASKYAAAAKQLKKLDPPILLAKVDAIQEEDLAKKYYVARYPTLRFFRNGTRYDYEGEQTEEAIVKFLKKVAKPTWRPDPEAVMVLTSDNFTRVVQQQELMLVEFYAPWCGHCKALAPKYEKAAKRLKNSPNPILLAKVDATAETGLAKEYGVSGYPRLKVFRKGQSYEYRGEREEDAIVEYMEKQRGDPAKPVDKSSLKSFLKVDDITVLGFFLSDQDDSLLPIYQDAVQDYRNDFKFGYTTDQALFQQYNAKPGSILVLNAERYYTKFEPKWHVFQMSEYTSSIEITKFVLEHQFPLVPALEGDIKERMDKQEPLCLVFFTVDWSFDHREATQRWRNKIAEIAKDFKEIHFAIADFESNQEALKDFGLEESSEEINMGIINKKKKYPMEPMEEYDSDQIREFLTLFRRDKIPAYMKSQPVPKKQKGPVKVVVYKSFDQIVRDKSKDVLIEMYAPWCGHCKKLEPIYKELAIKFKPAKDLIIAKMDAVANDTPDDYDVGGFPTIYFAPVDGKDSPVKYEGGRELKDLISFLLENVTVPLGPLRAKLQKEVERLEAEAKEKEKEKAKEEGEEEKKGKDEL